MKFEKLADEHRDAVYRQMLRVCGNREDAEDVLVEALLKAYRSMDQLRDGTAFRAWLMQIARRVCWHLRNREALIPMLQLSALEDEGQQIRAAGDDVEGELAKKEMREILRQAVAELPEGLRQIYVLRDVEDVPGEEVAGRLRLSLAAMKSRLHRARRMIRERLDAALAVPRDASMSGHL